MFFQKTVNLTDLNEEGRKSEIENHVRRIYEGRFVFPIVFRYRTKTFRLRVEHKTEDVLRAFGLPTNEGFPLVATRPTQPLEESS